MSHPRAMSSSSLGQWITTRGSLLSRAKLNAVRDMGDPHQRQGRQILFWGLQITIAGLSLDMQALQPH